MQETIVVCKAIDYRNQGQRAEGATLLRAMMSYWFELSLASKDQRERSSRVFERKLDQWEKSLNKEDPASSRKIMTLFPAISGESLTIDEVRFLIRFMSQIISATCTTSQMVINIGTGHNILTLLSRLGLGVEGSLKDFVLNEIQQGLNQVHQGIAGQIACLRSEGCANEKISATMQGPLSYYKQLQQQATLAREIIDSPLSPFVMPGAQSLVLAHASTALSRAEGSAAIERPVYFSEPQKGSQLIFLHPFFFDDTGALQDLSLERVSRSYSSYYPIAFVNHQDNSCFKVSVNSGALMIQSGQKTIKMPISDSWTRQEREMLSRDLEGLLKHSWDSASLPRMIENIFARIHGDSLIINGSIFADTLLDHIKRLRIAEHDILARLNNFSPKAFFSVYSLMVDHFLTQGHEGRISVQIPTENGPFYFYMTHFGLFVFSLSFQGSSTDEPFCPPKIREVQGYVSGMEDIRERFFKGMQPLPVPTFEPGGDDKKDEGGDKKEQGDDKKKRRKKSKKKLSATEEGEPDEKKSPRGPSIVLLEDKGVQAGCEEKLSHEAGVASPVLAAVAAAEAAAGGPELREGDDQSESRDEVKAKPAEHADASSEASLPAASASVEEAKTVVISPDIDPQLIALTESLLIVASNLKIRVPPLLEVRRIMHNSIPPLLTLPDEEPVKKVLKYFPISGRERGIIWQEFCRYILAKQSELPAEGPSKIPLSQIVTGSCITEMSYICFPPRTQCTFEMFTPDFQKTFEKLLQAIQAEPCKIKWINFKSFPLAEDQKQALAAAIVLSKKEVTVIGLQNFDRCLEDARRDASLRVQQLEASATISFFQEQASSGRASIQNLTGMASRMIVYNPIARAYQLVLVVSQPNGQEILRCQQLVFEATQKKFMWQQRLEALTATDQAHKEASKGLAIAAAVQKTDGSSDVSLGRQAAHSPAVSSPASFFSAASSAGSVSSPTSLLELRR